MDICSVFKYYTFNIPDIEQNMKIGTDTTVFNRISIDSKLPEGGPKLIDQCI